MSRAEQKRFTEWMMAALGGLLLGAIVKESWAPYFLGTCLLLAVGVWFWVGKKESEEREADRKMRESESQAALTMERRAALHFLVNAHFFAVAFDCAVREHNWVDPGTLEHRNIRLPPHARVLELDPVPPWFANHYRAIRTIVDEIRAEFEMASKKSASDARVMIGPNGGPDWIQWAKERREYVDRSIQYVATCLDFSLDEAIRQHLHMQEAIHAAAAAGLIVREPLPPS